MAERAAIITGGSGGIGLAIAQVLGEAGYTLTLSARQPDKLEASAQGLRDAGFEVETVAANLTKEEDVLAVAAQHKDRYGRLDALVNNAGVGSAGPITDITTKLLDLQLNVNLRATYLLTRECIPLLKQAGAEHKRAHLINTASIAGKYGTGWMSAYSATKFAVVGLTQAMHQEYGTEGIKATALCPAFVATDMTDWVADQVPKEDMIQTEDVAGAVRWLLSLSPACVVPEIQFVRPGDGM